ncbi:MAG: hypothetical protein LBH93_03850 [Chitinispirillales bacterium]|nr:hypothetical protein [Chitinispirillales bacterium]
MANVKIEGLTFAIALPATHRIAFKRGAGWPPPARQQSDAAGTATP